jgi:NitT/TauT family transport system substrate-binding protein
VTAIALENMAAAHHLSLNDFSIVVGGNTPARYAALQSGNVQGAMLAQPYDIIAASKGMNVLGSAYDTIKDWNFTAFIVNPSWANTNHATVVKFLRAMRKAIQYDYAHKAEAVADLVAVTHTDSETAGKAYDLDFTKWHAFDPNQRLSPSALENVGRYQVRFGAIKSVPAFSALADTTFIADVR